MTPRERKTPLIAALVGVLLLVGVGLWLQENRATRPLAADKEPARESTDSEGSRSPNAPSAVGPVLPELRNPDHDHEIVRGPNNTLLFAAPREVERTVLAGKHFPESILTVGEENQPGPLSANQHTISAIDAKYDEQAILRLINSNADRFTLPLGNDETVDVEIEQALSRDRGTFTIAGKVVDEPSSDVLFVFHDGTVFGTVAFHDRDMHFEYAAAGDGDIAIRQLDPRSFDARCGQPGPKVPPIMSVGAESEEKDPGMAPVDPPPPASAGETQDPGSIVIDQVVGYGIEARQWEGGTSSMEARIIASVDRTNLAFSNSMAGSVTLVLLGTVEDPDYDFPGDVPDSMGSTDELGDLDDRSDGSLDTVTDLMILLGADCAAFIVRDVDGYAGVAYRPGESMIVARTYMTSTRFTFVHELGHNIGCRHAWGDTSGSTTLHNYGWRFDPPIGGRVRTVMAYDWDWSRIPYFSNPDVSYNGAPTGVPNGHDARTNASADPRAVSGGLSGSYGNGYNGSHPGLGARNAHYIVAQAPFMADNRIRPNPSIIEILHPSTTPLADSLSTVLTYNVPGVGSQLSKTFTIRNKGTGGLSNIAVNVIGADSDDFTVTPPGTTTLAPNASTTFTVTFAAPAPNDRTTTLRVTSDDTLNPDFAVTLTGGIRTAFYIESFEAFNPPAFFGLWAPSPAGHWKRDAYGTPDSNTGPSTGATGIWYAFTEATGNAFETGTLEGGFNLAGRSRVWLDFAYHMYGSSTGTLSVDVFDGSWTTLWSLSGEQQTDNTDPWRRATVNLDAFAGQSNVRLRFRSNIGGGSNSDMAIDDIQLIGAPEYHSLAYAAGSGGSITGESMQFLYPGHSGSPVEAQPDPAHAFDMWSDGSAQNPRTDTGVFASVSVEAQFFPTYTTFSAWAGENSLVGDDALPESNPGNDGIVNVQKYAFNMTEPMTGPRYLEPTTGTSGLPRIWLPPGENSRLTVEFLRRKSVPNLRYIVQFAGTTDLVNPPSNWSQSGIEDSTTPIGTDWERVTFTDDVSRENGKIRWARVLVELSSDL
ncbi:MAG: choice-of-anchor D domain-containing protein [Verrucomicrobiota bacterium]